MNTLGHRLVGSWMLLEWRIEHRDGRADTHPFGVDATGLLVYAPDGWMNASIARAQRARLSAASTRRVDPAEQAGAFVSYFNYAGAYAVRMVGGEPHVVHQVSWSLNPDFVGSEQVRRMVFGPDDELTLSADESGVDGAAARHHVLRWRRAQAQTAGADGAASSTTG